MTNYLFKRSCSIIAYDGLSGLEEKYSFHLTLSTLKTGFRNTFQALLIHDYLECINYFVILWSPKSKRTSSHFSTHLIYVWILFFLFGPRSIFGFWNLVSSALFSFCTFIPTKIVDSLVHNHGGYFYYYIMYISNDLYKHISFLLMNGKISVAAWRTVMNPLARSMAKVSKINKAKWYKRVCVDIAWKKEWRHLFNFQKCYFYFLILIFSPRISHK